MTAAWILDEERKQDLTELRQLTAARPLEANEGAQQDQARAAKLQAKTADLRKVVRALRVLSEEPLRSGSDLAEQAIRQDPTAQLAYLANANYFRLRGHWLEFDRMMRYAAEGEQDPPVRSYLRAMEAFERYVDPVRCEKLEAKHAELQALKAMSPTHLVVRLAGPMIEQEFKTSEELSAAFQN
ncbi:MAG: hypothetical protein JRJ24_21835 [Deltaproteobacteria bacterium]|nr:hypothetical protein [Deltaproteobacteria bacterium]